MHTRRQFFFTATALAAGKKMTPKERVERALRGQEVDRPPFTFWYHFGLEKFPGFRHAKATLDFHRKFRTDLIKVMSDFPYPRPQGRWYELKTVDNPFPEQIRALEIIRDGLAGQALFIETVFNPYNQAEKLSSKEEVRRLQRENPQALLDALEAIARSEANHARRAIAAGAAGVFLAIANAEDGVLSREDYAKFSEPFDRIVLEAVPSAPLNVLHIHGIKVYLDRFYKGWPAAALNYSTHATSVPIADVRRQFDGVIMGGIDEVNYRTLAEADLRRQWHEARQAAGAKFILTPGCSVPNETTDGEMQRLTRVLGA
jgi:uroporphyrinogen decarboxylase